MELSPAYSEVTVLFLHAQSKGEQKHAGRLLTRVVKVRVDPLLQPGKLLTPAIVGSPPKQSVLADGPARL
jgi:hypothetical protein